jgi:hypothetical protein
MKHDMHSCHISRCCNKMHATLCNNGCTQVWAASCTSVTGSCHTSVCMHPSAQRYINKSYQCTVIVIMLIHNSACAVTRQKHTHEWLHANSMSATLLCFVHAAQGCSVCTPPMHLLICLQGALLTHFTPTRAHPTYTPPVCAIAWHDVCKICGYMYP